MAEDSIRPAKQSLGPRFFAPVKVAVTLGLLTLLLHRVDWALLKQAVNQLRSGFVALAFTVFLLIVFLETVRLGLAVASYNLKWREILRLQVVGSFFGSFVPGQMGADLYRFVALRPLDETTPRRLTLVFLPRLAGMFALVVTAIVSGPHYGRRVRWLESIGPADGLDASIPIAVATGAAIVLLAGLAVRSRLQRDAGDFLRRVGWALASLKVRTWAVLLGLSFLILAARAGFLWSLGSALGCHLVFWEAVFVVAFATLVSQIPISLAGLGLREGALALLLVSLEVPYEKAALVAFLGRAFMLLLAGAGGIWLARRQAES